jgi:Fe2+ or Zn2+ uptake regulation protein
VHAVAEEQEVAERLRQAGLKLTAQRLAIVRCIVGDETHPTAQELFDRLRPTFPTMSFATVYNTLAALTSVGACQPVQFGGPTRFDPNVAPHDHFVCEQCGCVRDVQAQQAQAFGDGDGRDGDSREPLRDFQVYRVERIYRGLCASCRTARE